MKRGTYLGGEEDPLKDIIPKLYEQFFDKKMLFVTLAILVIFSIVMLIWT